jgi:hypothetical protein
LIDTRAFALAGQKLTYYTIKLTIYKFSAAKRLADNIIESLVLDFEPKTKYTKRYQGLLQYRLPCWY